MILYVPWESWRSLMAEQRFCKPDRDEKPLVIFNGYKGFFVGSLGGGGWRGWYRDARGHNSGHIVARWYGLNQLETAYRIAISRAFGSCYY
jgi:hypothetical protein